ncbi:MAG: ATP-binding cassette domain-containing protein, partial [Kofleriaceae bacterium]
LVEGVDLDVRGGELVALVGPNGAGKSTLLAALAGDVPARAERGRRLVRGSIRIAERELRGLPVAELARIRAVLPQRSQLALPFRALEVVQLAGRSIDPALARRCLAEVELEGFAARDYTSLSGGEQQRVQLARVLAQLALAPGAALLLDEPTSALDPRHQQRVLAIARRAAANGRPVVVVLHDLTLAARWSDRIALLASGRIAADGPPEAVCVPDVLAAAYATSFEVLRGAHGLAIVHGGPAPAGTERAS